jgi:response regulator of citrate/malate metabolism
MIQTLVVEDDALVAEVHASYVERVPGFALAGVAHRATEALELLASRPVDLVLLDFHLPDVQGLDMLRLLRAKSAAPVDVIAVTAARDPESIRQAIAHGVSQYIVKPFAFQTFADKLERYARYRAKVDDAQEADQAEVDGLLGTLRAPAAPRLPKGLSKATYELVADVVRGAQGDLSASEVADAAGLSRVSARRYLEHLAAEGLVELGMRYGTTGRPEHRYRWRAARA